MSSLAFIPRKLTKSAPAKDKKHTSKRDEDHSSSKPVPTLPAVPAPDDVPNKYNDQDYANLITLSLSDYVLWIDPDLRRKFEVDSAGDQSYVSFDYLFEHSAALSSLLEVKHGKESSIVRSKIQAALVKGIRAHANDVFDVRLLLHSDAVVPRFGKQKDLSGGYEIRRKRLGSLSKGKAEWDACTLYLENIPPGYRSYAAIIRFLSDLLHDAPPVPSSSTLSADLLARVQGISFPAHYNDKLGARPTCKGFALVTFAHATDVEYLQSFFPWIANENNERGGKGKQAEATAESIHAAIQSKFRVTTKKHWLELKAEYLAYRQRLVEEINAHQDARRDAQTHSQEPMAVSPPTASTSIQHPSSTQLTSFSPYPPDCLLLVKNVHPDTTKTTLRTLFSQAFHSLDQKGVDGLGYVDFNKGMDRCYLRLAAPMYANLLVDHFDHHLRQIIQVSGMDESGVDIRTAETSIPKDLQPISVERVIGRPEEIYWEKVPAKVRKTAVEHAIQLMTLSRSEDRDTNHSHTRKHGRGEPERENGLSHKKSRNR
ncbi:hypothetical protein AGABI2DRAFT_122809 [Agaricus bisporus var. bisporus H97]|uniref:hypothetical protein n=1 Tax=Agaricus bisporus var. bisporus (strain H97 / ATCC MYA-4626 / FGSC 10389) TaxID=936046 RepID=UPI00029F5829|nr:hypothetical protein AGABI2DRAFT_122809 [Agaricus bisporus var. bisporus H97]EKV42595.1 hypothetical protein AGABI2DRAFT_122809 [Agaricus bisporus var. bisporus H97]